MVEALARCRPQTPFPHAPLPDSLPKLLWLVAVQRNNQLKRHLEHAIIIFIIKKYVTQMSHRNLKLKHGGKSVAMRNAVGYPDV